MPQARHGAMGVSALALLGSKLEGTGLENEQIGHTHVAGPRVGTGEGAFARADGEAVRLRAGESINVSGLEGLNVLRICKDACFVGFGYNVTFGEDLRKPACFRLAPTIHLETK